MKAKPPAVIARSASDEAIHFAVCGAMDCFAALAMTETTVRRAVIARSASDEAIHFAVCGAMDCFAEPVIGRRLAPTRWLAMTEKIFEFGIPDRSALRTVRNDSA